MSEQCSYIAHNGRQSGFHSVDHSQWPSTVALMGCLSAAGLTRCLQRLSRPLPRWFLALARPMCPCIIGRDNIVQACAEATLELHWAYSRACKCVGSRAKGLHADTAQKSLAVLSEWQTSMRCLTGLQVRGINQTDSMLFACTAMWPRPLCEACNDADQTCCGHAGILDPAGLRQV